MKEVAYKFEVGQKVVYGGILAIIDSRSVYASSGKPCYGLVAYGDSELTCTAGESGCELYEGQDIDETVPIKDAYLESERIRNIVKSVL